MWPSLIISLLEAPTPVLGCTDPGANNYDPGATLDDGSCTYDPSGPYDSNAQAYFDAVEAIPGIVSITDTQKQRYNDWVLYMKSIGLYSNVLAVFPCYGGIAAAHAINAKTLTSGNFHGTWIHNTSGSKPNGVDAYFDTGINPKGAMGSSFIFQMGIYTRTNKLADEFDLCAATTGHQVTICASSGTLGAIGRIGSDSIQVLEGTSDHSLGYNSVRRTSNIDLSFIKNGEVIATTTTLNSADLPNLNIYASAYNLNGTAGGFSTRQWCWIDIIGGVMDNTQIFNSNIKIEGIQDAFVRGVQ